MTNIVSGYFGNKHQRSFSKIVNFLKDLTKYAANDEMEIEPSGIVVIMINEQKQTELLHISVSIEDLQACALKLNQRIEYLLTKGN